MYDIFAYIYHKNQPNVGKYTIHGSYDYWVVGNSNIFWNISPQLFWGNDPLSRAYFSSGLVQPPSNISYNPSEGHWFSGHSPELKAQLRGIFHNLHEDTKMVWGGLAFRCFFLSFVWGGWHVLLLLLVVVCCCWLFVVLVHVWCFSLNGEWQMHKIPLVFQCVSYRHMSGLFGWWTECSCSRRTVMDASPVRHSGIRWWFLGPEMWQWGRLKQNNLQGLWKLAEGWAFLLYYVAMYVLFWYLICAGWTKQVVKFRDFPSRTWKKSVQQQLTTSPSRNPTKYFVTEDLF